MFAYNGNYLIFLYSKLVLSDFQRMHGSLIEMSLTFQTPSLNASCFAPGLKLANLLLQIKVKIEYFDELRGINFFGLVLG